ncbi:MAG TPA: NAD(P)-dependent oxidoreductase [Burkholderiaceae bacterium]|nr:NAD(P)-dependent oxidoreductase [Burkholderiaceae bacterium]
MSESMSRAVAFVGLGNIGAPMAMRVVTHSGRPTIVWNRTRERTAALAAGGAQVAPDLRFVGGNADVISLCVSDARALEDVLFGAEGLAHALRPDHLIVDHSTISPGDTRALAQRIHESSGARWVDAPVSGGPSGAAAGTLAVFAGGSADDVERAMPVLRAFAGRVTHMGPLGAGQTTKACNQLINVGTLTVVAEALVLASKAGLDPYRLPAALAGGFADSNILRNYATRLLDGSYSGVGKTATTLKDLGIVLQIGREADAALPVISLLEGLLRTIVNRGFTQDGMTGMMRLYADQPIARSEPGG